MKAFHRESQEAFSAVRTVAVARKFLALDRSHFISIIPGEFFPGFDEPISEKSQPREPEIMSVHEDVLNENIRLTGVVKVAADVTTLKRVHDKTVSLKTEKLNSGHRTLSLVLESLPRSGIDHGINSSNISTGIRQFSRRKHAVNEERTTILTLP